jgi:transcriptional regulator with XRE-family HTH domain
MDKPRLNRISIVLDEFNFAQKDLSKYLDVTENTVSRWCRNLNQPDLEKIYEIAKFFRIDNRRLFEPTNWETETGLPPYQVFLNKKAEDRNAQAENEKANKKSK